MPTQIIVFMLDKNTEMSTAAVGQEPEEVANFMKSSGHLWMKIASKVRRYQGIAIWWLESWISNLDNIGRIPKLKKDRICVRNFEIVWSG